jgi:hypothetical protein
VGKRQTKRERILMSYLLKALIKKLEGEIAVALANIRVYEKMAAGIGEHPDVVEAIETQIEKVAAAEEKIEMIIKYFSK